MLTMNEVEDSALERLVALQEVDRRLKDRRDRMTALVNEADGYELELGRQRDLVASITIERDTLEARRVAMDRQLEVSGNKIRDNRMRMNRVRNNTELLALQRDIDLSKQAHLLVEEDLLQVMESIETLAAQLSEAQAVLHKLEEQAEAEVARGRGAAQAVRGEVEGERAQPEA